MEIFFKKLIANISFLIMRVLDGLFDLFNIYTGTKDLPANAETGQEATDILDFFINNPKIKSVFYWILLIAVALLALFTIAGVIKNMVTNKKTVTKVFAEFGGALLAFFVTAIFFGGIVFVGNTALRLIGDAFDEGETLTLSQRIVDIAVDENGWRQKKDEETKYSAKDFPQDRTMTADEFFGKYEQSNWTKFEKEPGYDIEIDENGDEIVVYDKDTYDPKSGGMADLYRTNLFLLFITPLILFILIFFTLIALATRIYEIVQLYLYMPLIVSTIPFDDGAKFKLWREVTFSRMFSIYGTVIGLNLYLLFLGIMGDGINIGKSTWATTLFNLLFIIGGTLAARNGSTLFGQIIGATPENGKNLGQSIYSGMMMASAGAGIARGISGAIFGRKSGGGFGGGGRSGGLIRGIGKALDTGGKVLGGNKYTGLKTKASNGINGLKDTLKGGWMKNNGLIGTMTKPFSDYAQRNDLKDLIGEVNSLREEMNGGGK